MKKTLTAEQEAALVRVEKSRKLGFTKTDMRRMTYGEFDAYRSDMRNDSLAEAFVTAYFALHT